MGISFAGVALLYDDRDGAAQAHIDRFLAQQDFSLIGGRPCANLNNPGRLPIPNYTWPASIKLNTLYLPSGAARWGFFVGLVNTKMRDEILKKILPESNTFGGTFKISDDRETGKDFERTFYLLPTRPISVPSTTGDTLWLLPLVDSRWYWQFDHVGRIRCGWYSTWTSIIEQLDTTKLGGELQYQTVHADWQYPDRAHFEPPYQNLALYIDAVCNSVGTRLTYDGSSVGENFLWRMMTWPLAETALTENLTSAEKVPTEHIAGGSFDTPFTNITDNGNHVSGGSWKGSPFGGSIPEFLDIVFNEFSGQDLAVRKEAKNFITVGTTDGSPLSTTAPKPYIASVAKRIRTQPIIDNSGSPSTAAANLATKIADAYYRSVRFQYDYCFAGLKPWTMTGFDDWLIYSIGSRGAKGSGGGGGYEFHTRVISHTPMFDMGEQLQNLQSVIFEEHMRGVTGGAIAKGKWNFVTLYADDPTVQYLQCIGASSGSFTLKYGDIESTSIAYNASAATVQSAIEGMTGIGVGQVTCSGGPLNTAEVVVTFTGTKATYDNPRLVIGTSSTQKPMATTKVSATTAVIAVTSPIGSIATGKITQVRKIGQRYEATGGECTT